MVKKCKTKEQGNKDLGDRFAEALCSYHVGLNDLDKSDKPFKYVMTANGVVRIIKNKIGTFVAKVDTIQGLPEIEEGLILDLPKMPFELFQKTVSFFREVMKHKNGAEALLQFYFDDRNHQYLVYCPEQEVSGSRVDFKRNEDYDSNYLLVMDIHSHNSMPAFWSATDTKDEQETRIFGVVGNLNQPNPSWKFRISVGGVHKEIDLFDIFERPFPEIEFPAEWLDRCHKPKKSGVVYSRSGGKVYAAGKIQSAGSATSFSKFNDNTAVDFDYEGLGYAQFGLQGGGLTKSKTSAGFVPERRAGRSRTKDGYISYQRKNTVDVYDMDFEDQVDLVRDLLTADIDAVAKAIFDEEAYTEIEREIIRLGSLEGMGGYDRA